MSLSSKNSYLEEVLQQQEQVSNELRSKKMRSNIAPAAPQQQMAMPAAARAAFDVDDALPSTGAAGGTSPNTVSNAVEVRITGFWRWRTVVVPPNAYIVHTRRGYGEPIHIGIGISFSFNPYTDAFLVIPAVMQTIVINARCICRERQGILVQAYVQWIVDDVKTAYRKLDFSDAEDPMRVVNVQLREQAEAAIKDKVATMSIDEILTDKQPIIEELTLRLRAVAEGAGQGAGQGSMGLGSAGLGLKIVTVQIKEAVVSSSKLWENLQTPFRAEQQKIARLAAIASEKEIRTREMVDRREAELASLSAEEELERARYEQELALTLKRIAIDAEKGQAKLRELDEMKKLDAAEAERQELQQKYKLAYDEREHGAILARQREEILIEKMRRDIENQLSHERLQEKLLEVLPDVVEKLSPPQRSEQIIISSDGNRAGDGTGANGYSAALAPLVGIVRAVQALLKKPDEKV